MKKAVQGEKKISCIYKNILIRRRKWGKRLAVIFQEYEGYHCDKPILYYSRKLAKEQEYKEIISLEYSYTEKNIRGNEKRMKEVFDVLYQQAEKLLETIDFSKFFKI